ncbi:hypothetical protein HN858_02270 [Candidatus Falkowbacteria bacterium]|nr:hypothetical protein [Candidatus Falkowbacteria bacterium]MBT5503181.1 hypothetical protein [Candidatus Falkowbacteria bacterium]MBT6574569.1 hypothetical protein [Candidatus Falkowbacteria bacterium]MBT7348481.1 hypothetical protein [Candidatus Falkowbacteria bacterium]MBT7500854.1 hypothetical protein [Candidatus Falkowbacteria bacterium]
MLTVMLKSPRPECQVYIREFHKPDNPALFVTIRVMDPQDQILLESRATILPGYTSADLRYDMETAMRDLPPHDGKGATIIINDLILSMPEKLRVA